MRRVRWLWLLVCAAAVGCSDGGPVGTGIDTSSISGNIVAVDTSMRGTAALTQPVHVSIDEMPEIEDTTDADGYFELDGNFSGAVTLRFTAAQISATTELDVPLGSAIVLDDVELRQGGVRFIKPQLRRFFGRVALVDCTVDPPGAAEILANDRKPTTTNQFLIRLSADTVIIRGDGVELQCNQLRNTDAIAVEGVIRPDRTIDAIVVVIAPPPPTDMQPVVEVRFRGTVDVVNCTSGNIEMSDDMAGDRRLRLFARSVLVDGMLQATTCDTIGVGSRIEGKGLRVGRSAPLNVIRMTIRPPQ